MLLVVFLFAFSVIICHFLSSYIALNALHCFVMIFCFFITIKHCIQGPKVTQTECQMQLDVDFFEKMFQGKYTEVTSNMHKLCPVKKLLGWWVFFFNLPAPLASESES